MTVSRERSPRCWAVTPRWAGSARTSCRSPTRYRPGAPGERAGPAETGLSRTAGAEVAGAELAGAVGVAGTGTRWLAVPPQPVVSTAAASKPAATSLARISLDLRTADAIAAS